METENLLTMIIIVITISNNIISRRKVKRKEEELKNRTATEAEMKLDNVITLLQELKVKDDVQSREIAELRGEVNSIKVFLKFFEK